MKQPVAVARKASLVAMRSRPLLPRSDSSLSVIAHCIACKVVTASRDHGVMCRRFGSKVQARRRCLVSLLFLTAVERQGSRTCLCKCCRGSWEYPMCEISDDICPKGRTINAKLEYFNPLSSVKDRTACAIVEDAEKRGVLKQCCALSVDTAVLLFWPSPSRSSAAR